MAAHGVFAVAGLGSLPRRGRADGVSDVFHILMAVALIAMTWRPEPAVAVWLQAALLGSAVIWFALARPGAAGRFRAGRLAGLHHALMAGGMIWMITAMSTSMPMAPARPARGAMPAISMSRPVMSAAVGVVSVLLAAYFAVAAIPWFARAVGPRRRVNDPAAAGHAAMSAGMAAMLLAML